MLVEDFNHTIDIWIKELKRYNFAQLCTKPSPETWSLGQVYVHLIGVTNYFIKQVEICLSTDDNAGEEASAAAKTMFLNNDFPDKMLDGPPSNAHTGQPDSEEQLMSGLMNLKEKVTNIGVLRSKSQFKGKTKHPGLSYFNAQEWLQFAEMHFRHHLRQKKRIDDFLKNTCII
jgi:hypothetical protein